MEAVPLRGEVWEVDLGAVEGHGVVGRRPALVVSADAFNRGPAGLVVVVPLTTVFKGVPLHVEVEPSEGGVRRRSWAKPEDVRSISRGRLRSRRGAVSPATLGAVGSRLRVLLDL